MQCVQADSERSLYDKKSQAYEHPRPARIDCRPSHCVRTRAEPVRRPVAAGEWVRARSHQWSYFSTAAGGSQNTISAYASHLWRCTEAAGYCLLVGRSTGAWVKVEVVGPSPFRMQRVASIIWAHLRRPTRSTFREWSPWAIPPAAHLAFWIAGRHHVEQGSELKVAAPKVPLRGAISLAGAVDLRLTIDSFRLTSPSPMTSMKFFT